MSTMNRILTWMGLVDEGEPDREMGYGTGTPDRRPSPRGNFQIVDDQVAVQEGRNPRVAEPVPPYVRPAVVPVSGDSGVILRRQDQTIQPAGYTEILEARTFDDVRRVADTLREQVPVVVVLKNLDPPGVRRLVDFLCGLVYAVDGTLQKSAAGVLLVRPSGVSVARQELRRLASLGLYDFDA